MENLEKINPNEFGLQESDAELIESAFMPKIVERDAIKPIYEQLLTKEITTDTCSEAKSLRLKLVKVRTGIAEIHKTQKAFFLAAGRFVDAWKNKETRPVEQMEENLLLIEEHFLRLEKKRIAELQAERELNLLKYEAEVLPGNLGELTEQVWENYLLGVKTAYESKKAAEKAAKEAEIARIEAEREAQEKIRLENEQLKKEREELAVKAEAERKEREEAERVQREAHEAELRKERDERERVQKELAAKAEAERKEREEQEAKIQFELSKGDAAKVEDLIKDLDLLKTKYSFKSAKNKKMYTDVSILLDKIINHIKK